MTPSEIEATILRPAGVSSVVAILAAGANEGRVVCHGWEDAYRVLQHCESTHRTLQVRARPGAHGPVALTKTHVARLAAAEADAKAPPESPPPAGPFNGEPP